MPVDPVLAPLLHAYNSAPRPEATDIAERRRMAEATAAKGGPYASFVEPAPEVAEVREVQIPVRHPPGTIPVRTYRSERAIERGARGVLVVYHGGGWVMGNIGEADTRCRELADALDVTVVNVGYRLAPEFPFPTGPEDAYEAAAWAASQAQSLGVVGTWLGVCGQSAGGGLAAVVALLARDRGGPALSLQVLEIPGLDLTLSSPSVETYGKGYVLDRDDIATCVQAYLDGHDPKDPIVSPLWADDLSGLPPAVILTAECDPVSDDGRRYAERLSEAGVPVVFREFAGQVHGSAGLTALLPAAREWRQLLITSIRSSLG
jgi:acetyl esterase